MFDGQHLEKNRPKKMLPVLSNDQDGKFHNMVICRGSNGLRWIRLQGHAHLQYPWPIVAMIV